MTPPEARPAVGAARTRPTADPPSQPPSLLSWWPAAVGTAMALVSLWTDERGSAEGPLLVLLYATCGYAVIAFARRPAWSWPLLGALVVLHLAGELVAVPGTATLPTLILATVVLGVLLGRFRPPPTEMRWQAWSALAFVAAALAALWLGSTVAQVVVGVALLAHGAWDVVHWRRCVVVSRSLSQWCAGLDLVLGAGVLLLVAIP